MKLLVCGSRTFNQIDRLHRVLNAYATVYGNLVIIEGGAKGADRMARQWAEFPGVEVVSCPAEWSEHDPAWCPGEPCQRRSGGRYCIAAGRRRNQQMLDLGPDVVVAFFDKPWRTSRGTADMVRRAHAAGVRCHMVLVEDDRVRHEYVEPGSDLPS